MANFEQMMNTLILNDQGTQMPRNLPGGVVLDRQCPISPAQLNTLIFSPDSNFLQMVADFQGTQHLQIRPWVYESGSLKRVVTCTKAETSIIRALSSIEEQTYLKADGRSFAVLSSVNTPDAPYGSSYRTEILFCITPAAAAADPSSRLVVSWRMNFLRSTLFKGMIESGAGRGINASFQQFGTILSQSVNPNDFDDTQVVPPTSSSIDNPVVGTPSIVGTPSLLSRTIMALWNVIGSLRSSRLGVGDLSPLYSSVLAVSTNYVMELFSGSELEGKVMERAGCIDYSRTNWEIKTTNVFQRQTFYKFDEPNSRYRREVITSQKKIYLTDRHGWLVEEIMTLRGVPQSDYFTVHLKYHIEDEMSLRVGCKVEVSFGLSWLKTTEYKARITRNIHAALQERLRVLFDIMEKRLCD